MSERYSAEEVARARRVLRENADWLEQALIHVVRSYAEFWAPQLPGVLRALRVFRRDLIRLGFLPVPPASVSRRRHGGRLRSRREVRDIRGAR